MKWSARCLLSEMAGSAASAAGLDGAPLRSGRPIPAVLCVYWMRIRTEVETAKNRVAEPVEVIVEPFGQSEHHPSGAPRDCVTLVLAMRHSTRPAPHYAERLGLPAAGSGELPSRSDYHLLQFETGGTLLIGDQVAAGHPSVFNQCKLLEDCGFEHIDIAWRDRDFFVIGAARRRTTRSRVGFAGGRVAAAGVSCFGRLCARDR